MCAICGCSGSVEEHEHNHHQHGDHEHEHGHHNDRHLENGRHEHSHEHGHDDESASALRPHRPPQTIALEKNVLAKNALLAERNRGWLEAREILALNVMSSPGAGKTTLLERTIGMLGAEMAISVIEGDQATARDAERIRAAGARALQINTGAGCHLDAQMIAGGLRQLDPPSPSLLVIENVGNLVCPALFDLGERVKVVVLSVTEGDDKPLKYPHMFRAGDVVVLNKIDLLPYVSFDTGRFIEFARKVNPRLDIMQVSATRGDGLDAWCHWLRQGMARWSSLREPPKDSVLNG
jgi:hydrogenase nickel incorporation protein HypB